jgi:hypothetical protein
MYEWVGMGGDTALVDADRARAAQQPGRGNGHAVHALTAADDSELRLINH